MKHALIFLLAFGWFISPVLAQHSTVESEKWINDDLGHLYFAGGKVYFNFDGFDKYKNGYEIKRDTLKIMDTYTTSADNFRQKHVEISTFLINYFDGKKLVIKAVNENAVKLAGRPPLEFKNYKVSFDNSVKFSKLRFLSSTCYGGCPQLAINIWADGTYRLKGGEHAEPYKGDFAGKLSPVQLDSLNYLLKRSELKKMYNWKQGNQLVDVPNYYFDIDFSGGMDKLTITTNEPPMNITDLVAFLMQSYKKIKLAPYKGTAD
ncbi:hypothetical protein LX99_03127 [Mucilaginibacter oryzae]|uniref:DUF6438 domain-containing protein n=1 Tax=Mucilaginibacter oryzae TaxID=468058 RepID=A0A316HGF5_9SPHI|nr:DUF6438 domain-containing protein [Mucilaginibacter oryzae]PWK77315.1 hypothetical protein LX99_03127 [Mucilaginibacter oryzae]